MHVVFLTPIVYRTNRSINRILEVHKFQNWHFQALGTMFVKVSAQNSEYSKN